MFNCKALSFSYRPGKKIINDLSREIEKGLFYGLMGPRR